MRTTVSKITVDSIGDSLKSDKIGQAQIRQTIIRSYDAIQTSNSLKDALFTPEELGIESTDYTENRVTWVECAKDATVEDIQKQLAKFPQARIVKILSSSPILSDTQENVYKNGLRDTITAKPFTDFITKNALVGKTEWDKECSDLFMTQIKERQLVRYGENNTSGKPADEAIPYNGKVQYRVLHFSVTAKEDIDMRVELAVTNDIVLAPNEKAIAASKETELVK